MKKYPPEWLQSRQRLAKRRFEKRLFRKFKTYQRAENVTLYPPADLSFERTYNDTVKFLNHFRDTTLPQSKRVFVHVDLTTVQKISVPVAIVLAAEFDRWRQLKGLNLKVNDAEHWSPKVRLLFSDLGVFDLLSVKKPRQSGSHNIDNITLTPLQTGLRLDGQKLNRLQTRFRDILEGFTSNPGVYDGLAEAVENAIYHAYPKDYKPIHQFAGHRWWGAGCLDRETNRLRFFVFDQGAGIPFTLPSNALYEDVREWIAKNSAGVLPNDTVMLRAALETGRTRTGASHRGLGLRKMADVIAGTDAGYLRIISRRGEIVYHSNGKLESRVHTESVGGTLIEWCLPADALVSMGEDADEDN